MRARWERVHTPAGWHLRLKGGNGEIVLTSEKYADKRTATEALSLVRRSFNGVTDGLDLELTDVEET